MENDLLNEYINDDKGKKFKKKFKSFINRVLISLCLLIICLILIKVSPKAKDFIKTKVFNSAFNFSLVNKYYEKYFGSLNINKSVDSQTVSGQINYEEGEKYLDGVRVKTLGNNVYAIESGIVIFKGNKDGYNDTVIIQTTNGYDMWYGNLKNINVNIYDYVNKNDLISESNDKLYLVINKDNKFYTYKEYLSEKN